MTLPSDIQACASCGAALTADQRYCLNCGTAAPGAAATDVRALLADAAPAPVPGVAAAGAAGAGAGRIAVLPGREVSLGLAVGVFAFVLGLAAWAGAATTSGPGPAPIAIAAVPAAAAPPATGGVPADTGAADAAPLIEEIPVDTTDVPVDDAAVTDVPVTTDTTSDTTADTTTDTTTGKGDTTPAGGEDTSAADAPTTPPLKHVWLIALADQGYDTLFDPEGQGPYLAKDLAAKGTLLSRYFAVTTGGMANGVALTSGQGPNAATRAGCPTVSDVTPGTVGNDEQAAGDGCVYSTDVFSIADRLTAQMRPWRAYAGALDTAGPCPKPVAGSPFPAPRVPFLAFRTTTEDAACADRVTGLARLATDLADAKTTPALSYIVPGPCEDGSATPCSPGTAAGLPPADAFLRRTVPQILGSAAYKEDGGAIVILADQAPQGAAGADTGGCCENRPWAGKDVATSGGGRTGALVLSPLVNRGAVIDTALDHYDLLKSVALGLEVTPPGYASRKEVTGLPRETWARWKPSAAASRR